MFLMTPEGGYRIVDTDDTSLDVLGGIRYWHLSSELQFQPGVLPGINLQANRSWVDGIVAVRAKRTLADVWWASGYGDVGAGGSTSTYQSSETWGETSTNDMASSWDIAISRSTTTRVTFCSTPQ